MAYLPCDFTIDLLRRFPSSYYYIISLYSFLFLPYGPFLFIAGSSIIVPPRGICLVVCFFYLPSVISISSTFIASIHGACYPFYCTCTFLLVWALDVLVWWVFRHLVSGFGAVLNLSGRLSLFQTSTPNMCLPGHCAVAIATLFFCWFFEVGAFISPSRFSILLFFACPSYLP